MTRDNATSRARRKVGFIGGVSTSRVDAPTAGAYALSPGAASGEAAVPAPGCSLAAALLGFFVVTLDAVIVNVALPDIRRDLAGGMSGLQWVMDGYTLIFAALLLSAGSLSDRVGARRAFGAGLVVFVLASAACGLAPSLFQHGLRASLLIAAAVALATAAVTILIRPAEAYRAKYAGYGRAYVQAMLAGAAADATLELTPSNERTP